MRLRYPESSFGGFTRCDGTVAFYLRVNALLRPESIVLDVGCGRGEYADDPVEARRALRFLRGKCAHVIGLDPDPSAASNACIDEFRPLDCPGWPVDEATVDLCLADNVLEHVADPVGFLSECRRVLRPGGYLCIRTSNALGYASMLARIIPNTAHSAILKRVQPERDAVDIFPTLHRCNTRRRLQSALNASRLDGYVYAHGPEPSYLEFSATAYALGAVWARLGPLALQNTLLAFARRTV